AVLPRSRCVFCSHVLFVFVFVQCHCVPSIFTEFPSFLTFSRMDSLHSPLCAGHGCSLLLLAIRSSLRAHLCQQRDLYFVSISQDFFPRRHRISICVFV